ncbi:MAG: winged helix-turn-helix domain-containing protein [Acidimicrobiales bacterium]
MSEPELDPVIHAPKRLKAMAILVASDSAEFRFLRESIGIRDADLSKQMSTLEEAGYITIRKTKPGRGSSTWYKVTKKGRSAFTRHSDALRELLSEPNKLQT